MCDVEPGAWHVEQKASEGNLCAVSPAIDASEWARGLSLEESRSGQRKRGVERGGGDGVKERTETKLLLLAGAEGDEAREGR